MPDLEPRSEPTPDSRGRLRASLTHPSKSQYVVAVILALVGFALVLQVKATQTDDSYAGFRDQDLIDVLAGLSGAAERAEREIERLEQTRQDLQSDTNTRDTALEQARREANALAILAGQVPVTGPGLRISIEEIDGRVSIDTLLDTIQELRSAGAEAMQFNNEVRVIAQTAFEEATGGILIDGVLLQSPYTIDVIGEPHVLHGALTFPLGPMESARRDGARITAEELDAVDIESVRPGFRPQYANADEDE
ncbi:DUF881 domain-containing protein [Nocardioides limicola]|uniref:DUF881 domain-containing protein n=1 Tax=Nocardioides limicola TaxID=2803368 RepID=UPI00193B738F|nr:DUF881 domain-containing protein [Nocardioides sp. DJM-14]